MVPPAFAANGGLGVRCNGRARPSYYRTIDNLSYTSEGMGEVDFAVFPAISHWPMALCMLRVQQLLVFTLSGWA